MFNITLQASEAMGNFTIKFERLALACGKPATIITPGPVAPPLFRQDISADISLADVDKLLFGASAPEADDETTIICDKTVTPGAPELAQAPEMKANSPYQDFCDRMVLARTTPAAADAIELLLPGGVILRGKVDTSRKFEISEDPPKDEGTDEERDKDI